MQKLLKYILLLLFTVFISCKKDSAMNCVKGAVNPNCICPLVVSYVCGCNHQTYDNSCYAACDGITTYTKGRCP